MFLIGFLELKWLKSFFTALYVEENILYFNKGSCDAVFNGNGMGIVNIDLHNINLDNKFD